MMRNKTARDVALEVLLKVDEEQSYSNLQLNKELQKVSLSKADVNFATEMVYGTIQHLNTIDWILDHFLNKKNKLSSWVENLLRLSVYQIWYLDKIPNHAIVNEAVNIAKARGHKGIVGFVNGVLRNVIRKKEVLTIPTTLNEYERISLEYSHPEWMVRHFIEAYGIEEATNICRVNNLAPYHSVRVNPLKASRDDVIKILVDKLPDDTTIQPSPLSNQGIRLKGGGNLAYSKLYKEGYITIQDESSMLVAEVLDPKPGMFVLDAMAAPGGKTTHIAEKMENRGRIIASDIHEHKIKLIKEHQDRLGIDIIETLLLDARELKDQFEPTFDRILLDVPCSGLGVIRRKPDLKWMKADKDIEQLAKLQKEILETVSSLLKENGVLVYSTCTISKQENERLILDFIDKHPAFILDKALSKYLPEVANGKIDTSKGMVQILPNHFHTDGFFISRLIKTGENT